MDEKRVLWSMEHILDEELLDSYTKQEDEKELFNEDIIIENTIKCLSILARDFEYPMVTNLFSCQKESFIFYSP